jgi:hypothetical protein
MDILAVDGCNGGVSVMFIQCMCWSSKMFVYSSDIYIYKGKNNICEWVNDVMNLTLHP